MKDEEELLKIAKEAALKAGEIISGHIGKKQEFSYKNNDKSNFATKADVEAEKAIVALIKSNFPTHNIIAEEDTRTNNGSEYTWVIDPLDGTISFASNVPYFGVSIGLLKDNKPILGVIYNVSFKKLYWAQEGKGAYLNNKQIHVSQKKTLDDSVGVLDFGHNFKRQQKIDLYIWPLITKIGYAYSFGAAVTSLGMVAEGIIDLDVNQAWIWDFAAGAIITCEAGGMVTDFEGAEPDWSKDRLNLVASNGLIHDEILKALKK